jgi:hypothetical protein
VIEEDEFDGPSSHNTEDDDMDSSGSEMLDDLKELRDTPVDDSLYKNKRKSS